MLQHCVTVRCDAITRVTCDATRWKNKKKPKPGSKCSAVKYGGENLRGPDNVLSRCRVGYLTLFGGEQNNCSDLASIYKEYKKFDGLLTKMARGTLKSCKED